MPENVLVLMCTYQGESYLSQQLDSIINQSHSNWTLLVRDDGSLDKTVGILKAYTKKDCRIKLIQDNLGRLGACQSFAQLMQIAQNRREPYVLLSDQDDVWHQDKIELSLNAMKKVEAQNTPKPILVYTDLRVVDEKLLEISPSYWSFQKLNSKKATKLNRLLVQNVVTGCTIMINKPLIQLAANIPREAIMHDWWLALVASAFGKLIRISKATLDYRQHSKNQIRTKKWGLSLFIEKLNDAATIRSSILKTQSQADAFLMKFEKILSSHQIQAVSCYAELAKKNIVLKRYLVWRYGFLKIGFLRNIAFFIFL